MLRTLAAALVFALAADGKLQLKDPYPCGKMKCPELVCPASAKVATYPGHCCPYCEVTVKIKDTTDYSTAALDAFNAYATAPYAGGYKSGKFKNKISASRR